MQREFNHPLGRMKNYFVKNCFIARLERSTKYEKWTMKTLWLLVVYLPCGISRPVQGQASASGARQDTSLGFSVRHKLKPELILFTKLSYY